MAKLLRQTVFELSDFFKVSFKRVETEDSIGRQSATKRLQSAASVDRKDKIHLFLKEQGHAKVSELTAVVGLSEGRVRDSLREMVSDGAVEKVGNKRYAYYVLKSNEGRLIE